MVDIQRAVDNFKFFASSIRTSSTSCNTMSNKAINYTLRKPVGVCGLITPWNLPLYLLSWKVAPALACGNSVICKPSELTPMSAHLLAEVIHEAGVPEGVFNLVHGYGSEVGAAIVQSNIQLLSFTGGTFTGRKISQMIGFKKLSLELGGKNNMIIFSDCDYSKALNTAYRAAFANQGQICLCTERMFVQEDIYDKFIKDFVNIVKSVKIGDPSNDEYKFGSLISKEHREKIEYYVELAKKEGGKIVAGGKIPKLNSPFDKGAFYEPTVITNLKYDSRVSTEEVFGPIVTIHKFKTEKDLIPMVNFGKFLIFLKQ